MCLGLKQCQVIKIVSKPPPRASISTKIPCMIVYTKRCYELVLRVDHRMPRCCVALVAALTWPKSDSTPRRDSDRSSAQLSAERELGKSLPKREIPVNFFAKAMFIVCYCCELPAHRTHTATTLIAIYFVPEAPHTTGGVRCSRRPTSDVIPICKAGEFSRDEELDRWCMADEVGASGILR